ncbi:MAG: nucleotide sugar dehydrogenase [Gemmatimonadota bacterium]
MTDPIERLSDEDITFGVLGLGYVGLPLAVEAARAGLSVIGFDVKPAVATDVNSGRSHIQDLTDDDVAGMVDAGRLEATTDMDRLSECDAVSICVPTPLSKTRDPDVSFILAATEAVAKALQRGQLVVLESTTYPGTTREVVLPALEASGLEVGRDFYLCFSPERVDPGNETWKIHNTPKVIGGVTKECTAAGRALYGRFIETMVPVSSTEAAELTKLLENTFRAVNIGLVNEIALMADRLGVNVWEVVEAADSKPFGFMKFVPGPGLGGHCIPVDPEYLSWKMRTLNYRTRFIEVASEVNAQMPEFVAGKVAEALNDARKPVNGSRIVVLGVAYKPDINDVRESPAVDVMKLLEADGAEVVYHDPYVPRLTEDGTFWESREMTDDLLTGSDAVVIVTDHSDFDYARIVELSPILVDARNATADVSGIDHAEHPEGWIIKG